MSMQVSPNVGRYGLRPAETVRAYEQGEHLDMSAVPWSGPIPEEEQCEYDLWWLDLTALPEDKEEEYDPYWDDPWWAYEWWPGWDRLLDAEPDLFPDQVGLEKLGYYDDWRYISLQAIDAYAEQVIRQEEHDEWTAWVLDVMETGAFLREVFGERKRRSL